ncbi:hypothetical protein BHE74_00045013 [Ensete ventricosum]|nr:hypothetical protein BHE74_00045013 [Ensete ventricosum]RZS04412.1 hypothetical protein BHM03_00034775 [Ensete ventricosum]
MPVFTHCITLKQRFHSATTHRHTRVQFTSSPPVACPCRSPTRNKANVATFAILAYDRHGLHHHPCIATVRHPRCSLLRSFHRRS